MANDDHPMLQLWEREWEISWKNGKIYTLVNCCGSNYFWLCTIAWSVFLRPYTSYKLSWVLNIQTCSFSFISSMGQNWDYHQTRLHVQVWFSFLLNKLEFVYKLLDYLFLIFPHIEKWWLKFCVISQIFTMNGLFNYVINKLQIIIWFHMNLFTKLCIPISSLYESIFRQVNI